jgi:hypothetical protein
MDKQIFEIKMYDYTDNTILLWSKYKTTRIPMFYLTNPVFLEALNIKILQDF